MRFLIELKYKRNIYLETENAKKLKLGKYLSCILLNKSDVAIFKIFFLAHLIGKKLAKIMKCSRFWQFLANLFNWIPCLDPVEALLYS